MSRDTFVTYVCMLAPSHQKGFKVHQGYPYPSHNVFKFFNILIEWCDFDWGKNIDNQ